MNNSAHMPHRLPLPRLLPFLALALLAAPATADAHSLFGNHDPNRPLIDYLTLGFGHMVGGWDHLLFIGGVVLLAGNWRRAAKLISLFVAGHSLTLLIATIAGWKLDATAVDVVIALSLVFVGVLGIRGAPQDLKLFGAAVFGFGLVHGLGLSTRLQDLGLPEDGVVGRVLLFNVGVELGQLAALAVIVGIGTLLVRGMPDRGRAARYACGAIALSGLVAAAMMSFPDAETRSNRKPLVTDAEVAACTQQDTQPPAFAGGDHPPKQFFGPDEEAPEADFAHVIGDGLIAVRYRPDLSASEVNQLRAFVVHPESEYVIGAADPEQDEPVRVVAAVRTLTCTEVDVAGLETFRDDWLAFVRAQQG
jgi:hydrogenase/urease accessory protein HupE